MHHNNKKKEISPAPLAEPLVDTVFLSDRDKKKK